MWRGSSGGEGVKHCRPPAAAAAPDRPAAKVPPAPVPTRLAPPFSSAQGGWMGVGRGTNTSGPCSRVVLGVGVLHDAVWELPANAAQELGRGGHPCGLQGPDAATAPRRLEPRSRSHGAFRFSRHIHTHQVPMQNETTGGRRKLQCLGRCGRSFLHRSAQQHRIRDMKADIRTSASLPGARMWTLWALSGGQALARPPARGGTCAACRRRATALSYLQGSCIR